RGAIIVDGVEAILAKISHVRWFAAAGRGAGSESSRGAARAYAAARDRALPVRWEAGWDGARAVVRGLDDEASFWRQEEAWRQQAAKQAEAAGRAERLTEALHRL